jgi:general secretion pathway protein K
MILLLIFFLVSAMTITTANISEDQVVIATYTQELIKIEEIRNIEKTVDTYIQQIFKKDDATIDSFREQWSDNYTLPTNLGTVSIEIIDQERYLNPNNLIDNTGVVNDYVYQSYQKLFTYLNFPDKFIDSLVDWVDNQTVTNPTDVQIPFKNAKIDSIEEMRYIPGVDDKIFNGYEEKGEFNPGLRTIFSAYTNGRVNINTASKDVLIGLDPAIDGEFAEKIIEYRADTDFTSVDDLIQVGGADIQMIFRLRDIADVKSENFIINITVSNNDRTQKLMVLYQRDGAKMKKIFRRIE